MSEAQKAGDGVNPYAAPSSDAYDEQPAPTATAASQGYRDQTLVVRTLMLSLGLQALGNAFNTAVCAALLLIELEPATQALVLYLNGGSARLSQPMYLVGVIPFAIFLVRSNKNARLFVRASDQLDAARAIRPRSVQEFTPASMIWWFAVPFFNLVKPYQAVAAVWSSSSPEDAEISSTPRDNVLSAWWIAWVVAMIWARTSSLVTAPASDPQAHNVVVAISTLLSTASCLLALRMVLALHQRQQACASELWR